MLGRKKKINRLARKVRAQLAVVRIFGGEPWGYERVGFQDTDRRRHKKFTKAFFRRKLLRRSAMRRRFQRYTYRLEAFVARAFRRRLKKAFTSLRWTRLFYIVLSYKQFRRMARRAHRKDGFFEGHYCLALEGRVGNFLYRTGFVATLFEALVLVRGACVTIRGRREDFAHAAVGLYKLLRLHAAAKYQVYGALALRLCANAKGLFNPPRYMFVSH